MTDRKPQNDSIMEWVNWFMTRSLTPFETGIVRLMVWLFILDGAADVVGMLARWVGKS